MISSFATSEGMNGGAVSRSMFDGIRLLAMTWFALVAVQLVRSMRIDAYELSQSQVDLLGYWLSFVMSMALGLRLFRMGRLMMYPVILTSLLIVHMTIVRVITAPAEDVVSFLLSRYGLVMWFVLGIGFAAVLDIFQPFRVWPHGSAVKAALLVVIGSVTVPALSLAQEIILSPVETASYQAVASSLSIYLIVIGTILVSVWGKSLPLPVLLAYVGLTAVLISAVALLQSTSIVALGLGLIVCFFYWTGRYGTNLTRFVITAAFLGGVVVFAQSEFFEDVVMLTRFSALATGYELFTSVTSRLELLSTFRDQFAVSPIFGHFQAEIVSGAGEGNYVHSLPLSFLTHTGIIGTGILSVILIFLFRSRRSTRKGLNASESFMNLLMWLVLALGAISTFITWSVFWFMLGLLCRRPLIDMGNERRCR
jgi:hypothetical protein